jgi:DNA segregation ATPase FtsK/SpoIIIE-like protein
MSVEKFIPEAKEVSLKVGYVSASWLQRQMPIGYTTAAHIVDILVAEGFCVRDGDSHAFKVTPNNARTRPAFGSGMPGDSTNTAGG